jgi:translocation and assembly module TamB
MRKVLKITLYTLGSILLLIVLLVIWLNTPSGQNFVRGKAEKFLRDKLKTEVYIGKLGYGLPKNIVLENLLLKDQANDTLLAVEHLKVNINMLKLISSKVEVKKLELWGVNAHIYRNAPDTNFNFSYIIDAFAGKKTGEVEEVKEANDTSSLSFDVNEVQLANIRFRFDDYTGGSRFGMALDSLDLRLREFDPVNMNFAVRTLDLRGLRTSFIIDTSYLPPKEEDTTASKPIRLAVDDLKLKNIGFDFEDVLGRMKMNYLLGNLEAKPKTIDLENQIIAIDKLLLQNTAAKIWMGKASPVPEQAEQVAGEVADSLRQGNWNVRVADIRLDAVNFIMDNDNEPRKKEGIDYAHLNVKDLAFVANAIIFTGDTIAGDVKHIALKEQSGLDLRELRTNFSYHPQGAVLEDLYLQTSQTLLKDYLQVGWPSMEAMQKDPNIMSLKVNLVQSIVGVNDLLIFVPSLAQQQAIKQNRNGTLRLDAVMDGFLSSLGIDKFYLAGLGNTLVNLNGRLSNVANPDKLAYDLNILDLSSSSRDISGFVPKEALASIRIPDRFSVRGKVAGGTMDYRTPGLTIATTDGNAFVNGSLLMSPGKGRECYDLALRTSNLNVGRIMKDTMMGAITAGLRAKGTSFDINNMAANVAGDIQSAYYKGYNYNSIDFTGKVDHKVADIKLNSADPNARLNLDGHADLNGNYPAARADINIDSINLYALNLYASELRTRGKIHIDAPELNPDYPDALLTWISPVIVAGDQRYFTDSFTVVSRPSADSGQNISINFDALQAKITGKTPLTRLGDVIQEHINRHYSTATMADSTAQAARAKANPVRPDTGLSAYDLRLVADIRDRPILHAILPGLEYLDTIHIDAALDKRNLALNATAPRVVYAGNTIENGLITVNETDSSLNYDVTVDKFEQSSLRFWYTRLYGNLRNKTITANASIADSARAERFALAAQMKQEANEQIIELLPGLKLDYDTWNVAQPNKIVLAKDGLYIQNFEISNAGQSLSANSQAQQPNAPMTVDIRNFVIGNFTNIISKDTTLANGVLNGNINLERLQPSPQVVGDIKIQELSLFGDTLGNLDLKANNKTENAVNVDMTLAGNGNDIGLKGDYYLKPVAGNSFDFMLGMRAFNLRTIEGISQNSIRNSVGFLRGELSIKGSPSVPVVTGNLTTDNLTTTISMLNSQFNMPNEKITFDGNGINFQQFRILDSAKNQAMIDGQIQTKDFRNMDLNLRIKADNWQALNSTKKDNDLFYGKLFLSTNLNITGTPTSPTVDGSLNILKGTDFTVVSPDNDPSIVSSDGIVQFYNGKDSLQYLPVARVKDTTFRFAPGSNININLGLDKEASFSFIIDKATGDFVNVKGDAALNANVGNDGAITLTGAYTIDQGAYMLNYNLIRRRFQIQKGSTVTFAGDPLEADVNITAVYVANVPAYDLVERQVPDPSQLNYFKQRLPFDVQLLLRGELMKPYISFNIDLPEDKVYRMAPDQLELVRGKLAQIRLDTSELTKQVFAVLLLNRFISDDPFSSGASTGLAFTAKQSVSRLLGEQLNKFANDLIKGVDLQVDLAQSEDYTTGARRERTDLSIAASKSLLNDRLKVTIGNDFELQGPQSGSANQNTSYLPGNLAADYNLTTDGRYVLRAYRRAYDEGVLQGFVTETGLNFIFTRDYNTLKQLFRSRRAARERQARRDQRRGVDTAARKTETIRN